MNRRAYELKVASQIEPGGSEDDAKYRVKELMKPIKREYYTEEDIKELSRERAENTEKDS